MPRTKELLSLRARQFRAALVLEGVSMTNWREEHRVARTHLECVLSGERPGSARLNAAIDVLIARNFPPNGADNAS